MVQLNEVIDHIAEQWEQYIVSTGRDAGMAREQMKNYLHKVEPRLETALAEGDTRSWEYIKAELAGEAGRTSLGLIHRETAFALNFIRTILFTVMRFALGVDLNAALAAPDIDPSNTDAARGANRGDSENLNNVRNQPG